ncbi:hypothetical protein [Pararobbsia alpina]|uniref:hypothetical protein n=1 Tax=Pararobbsia alpina TaxID=621374 RepID=UPI0039A54439
MHTMIDTAVAPPAGARVRVALLRLAVAPPTNVAVAVAPVVAVAGVAGAYPPPQSPPRD